MQHWKTEDNSTDAGSFHDYRPRARAPQGHPSVVASGGSVGPFLRKFYRHQVVVSAPVQRFFLFVVECRPRHGDEYPDARCATLIAKTSPN